MTDKAQAAFASRSYLSPTEVESVQSLHQRAVRDRIVACVNALAALAGYDPAKVAEVMRMAEAWIDVMDSPDAKFEDVRSVVDAFESAARQPKEQGNTQ